MHKTAGLYVYNSRASELGRAKAETFSYVSGNEYSFVCLRVYERRAGELYTRIRASRIMGRRGAGAGALCASVFAEKRRLF